MLRFKEKVNAVSYKTILLDNYKYYRFKTTFRYMFFLTVLHVVILFVYAKDIAATMTAEDPEKLFPYDYVCIADTDDMKDFKMLSDSGLTEQTAYPMVRVSGPGLADEFIYAMDGSSIGQHIGISETSYRQICEHAGRKAKSRNLPRPHQHDPKMASNCKRILFLRDGQILEDTAGAGNQEDFYKQILEKMKEL